MNKPTEFDVMRFFVESLPQIDTPGLMAMLEWMRARGEAELSKRNDADDSPPAQSVNTPKEKT